MSPTGRKEREEAALWARSKGLARVDTALPPACLRPQPRSLSGMAAAIRRWDVCPALAVKGATGGGRLELQC